MKRLLLAAVLPILGYADILVTLPPDAGRIDAVYTGSLNGVTWQADSTVLNGYDGVYYIGFNANVSDFTVSITFDANSAYWCNCTPYINIGLNSYPYSPHLTNGYQTNGVTISASGQLFDQSSMWIYYAGRTIFGNAPPKITFTNLVDPPPGSGVQQTPEPATFLLTGLGLLALVPARQWLNQRSKPALV